MSMKKKLLYAPVSAKKQILNLLLLLSFAFIFFVACGFNDKSDGDDSDDQVEDDDNDDDIVDDDNEPGCENSRRPELLGITLRVNGETVEMGVTVTLDDTLAVALEYADPGCDLGGGRINTRADEREPFLIEINNNILWHYLISDDIGCSSADEGAPYLHQLDPNDYLLPDWVTREYPIHFALYDKCDNVSDPNFLPLDFTVVDE